MAIDPFANPYGNRFAGQAQPTRVGQNPRYGAGTDTPPDPNSGQGGGGTPSGGGNQNTAGTFASGNPFGIGLPNSSNTLAANNPPAQTPFGTMTMFGQGAPTQSAVNANPSGFAGTSFDPARALTFPGSPYGPGTGNVGGGGGQNMQRPGGPAASDTQQGGFDFSGGGGGAQNPAVTSAFNSQTNAPDPNRPPAGAVATHSPTTFMLPTGNTWITPGTASPATDNAYLQNQANAFGSDPERQFLGMNYAGGTHTAADFFSPESVAWFTRMYGRAPREEYRDPRYWTQPTQPR